MKNDKTGNFDEGQQMQICFRAKDFQLLNSVPLNCTDGLRAASYAVDVTLLAHQKDVYVDDYGLWGRGDHSGTPMYLRRTGRRSLEQV